MRIISKIRDYYDGGAAFGIDKTVVFERKPRAVVKSDSDYKTLSDFINIPYSFFSSWYGDNVCYNSTPELKGRHRKLIHLNYQLHKISIIVAGVKYYGRMLVSKDWTPTAKEEVQYFWTNSEYNEWIKTQIPSEFHNQFESSEEDYKYVSFSLEDTKKEYLLENRIVIISLDIRHDKFSRNVVVNGDNLVLYGLQRIIDSTTMFHNIDQWISLMNDPSRKMIEISDKDKIAKHGMDKTSFRNV